MSYEKGSFKYAVIPDMEELERLMRTNAELLEALKGAIAELYLIHSKYGDREHAKDCCYAIRHGEEIIAKAEGE